jgi:trans-aconitate 2-methyltransferase
MAPRDWDAAAYERLSAPMAKMAQDVLPRLELRGDETVLDAGCGTGKVTAELVERLPRGRVLAVDGSQAMVEQARRRLPDRAEVFQADLLELELPEPVDAILSTATFHWILDHDRLFTRLREALKPGGRLVAQCGGEGNIAAVQQAADELATREPFAPYLRGTARDKHFASPAGTEARLRRLGWADVWCWSSRVDVDLSAEDTPGYLEAICLGASVEALPAELRDAFVEQAVELLGAPLRLEYVRLNILARRPPSA